LDIITIAICAVICGCDKWEQVAEFGNHRRRWLKRFLPLPNGIPSHDTFERVFAQLDPRTFASCFHRWTQSMARLLGLKQIAIDGKSMRSSGNSAGLRMLHLVSAWTTTNHLTLGQVAVEAKSNEITAIPELLKLLDINGALVSIDAMGCQKAIARDIVDRGGDYILQAKNNQPNLLEDARTCIEKAVVSADDGQNVSYHETQEKGHGRKEKRRYTVVEDPQGIRNRACWKNLTVVGCCESERTIKGKTSTEVRYFIGSRSANAKAYGAALRNHWSIENNLHWQLDVSFKEDESGIENRNAAENFAMLRKIALMLLKRHPDKQSIATKRLQAGWNTDFLEEVLDLNYDG